MRLSSKSSGADIWPPYNLSRVVKENWRPPSEAIYIRENGAKCDLQPLLHHTAARFALLQQEVILQVAQNENSSELKAVFILSWGVDGTNGFSSYKQRYSEADTENNEEISDSSLFATTCIPLRLTTSSGIILWNNATSQFEGFCRPISLTWVRETTDIILGPKQLIENQVEKLVCLKNELDRCRIRIHFSFHLTLINGKVQTAITNTRSAPSCPIFHSTHTQFNDLGNKIRDKFSPDPMTLIHETSHLHN